MKFDKLLETLFSTKNLNKILTEFNKLSPHEKETILSNDKVKERTLKIADINLLVNILIDLSYNFRINFLNSIDNEKYNDDISKLIIDFLKSPKYGEFDFKQLPILERLKDKQILTLMLRKLSTDKLKAIILANYCQFINDFAFLEYSKRIPNLTLESDLVNNINTNILFTELKRRKAKQRNTNINIKEFIKISYEKQSGILSNGSFKLLEDEIIKAHIDRNNTSDKQSLIERFTNDLNKFNYAKLIELQTIIYTIDDDNAMILMQSFFKEVLKFKNDVEKKHLKSMIFLFRKLNEKSEEIFEISKMKPFTIINYLNTGIINNNLDKLFEKHITIEQYQKINLKKLYRINRLLNKLYNNDDNISEDNIVVINSYKLYLIFGYDNSIELLTGRFGNINFDIIIQLLNYCDVKNVCFDNVNNSYEPSLNKEFIQFFIGDKKDNNTTIKRMLRGELDTIKREFYNLYNNFDRFKSAIGNKIHLNKLLPLLEESPFILLPNEYKLTKDIIDAIIKSYRYLDVIDYEDKEKNEECIKEACDFYHNYLEKRVVSSIPRIYGTTEEHYSYEILKLDDPIIMTLGYYTNCCFRLNGLSREFLRYCSESAHARVIVIKNEYKEICAMIPIIRNGNVIVGNSIEHNSKGDNIKIYKTLKIAYDEILRVSSENEKDPIIACLVTNLHSNCYSGKHTTRHIYPIRDESFYTNYDSETYIVTKNKDKDEKDFKFYTPNAIYYDERPEILVYRWGMNNNTDKTEIEKRIKSINYRLNQNDEEYIGILEHIVCSEDWYLVISYYGIRGKYIQKDPRAIDEYNATRNYLTRKFENTRITASQLDEAELNNTTRVKKRIL